MAVAKEFKSGNATIQIMDDFCSAPNQAERDKQIWRRVHANVLTAIRANPEGYYALRERKEKGNEQDTGGAWLTGGAQV